MMERRWQGSLCFALFQQAEETTVLRARRTQSKLGKSSDGGQPPFPPHALVVGAIRVQSREDTSR